MHLHRLCFGRSARNDPTHKREEGKATYTRPEGWFNRWRQNASYHHKVRMADRVHAKRQLGLGPRAN